MESIIQNEIECIEWFLGEKLSNFKSESELVISLYNVISSKGFVIQVLSSPTDNGSIIHNVMIRESLSTNIVDIYSNELNISASNKIEVVMFNAFIKFIKKIKNDKR